MDTITNILTFFGGSILGGFIGYFIKHFLDLRYSTRIDELNRKRQVYEDMIDSLNVFVSGRTITEEKKNKFLKAYSSVWLWAPDSVVLRASYFLDMMIQNNKNTVEGQEKVKHTFAELVIEIRKDLGYSNTILKEGDYKFVSFGN